MCSEINNKEIEGRNNELLLDTGGSYCNYNLRVIQTCRADQWVSCLRCYP